MNAQEAHKNTGTMNTSCKLFSILITISCATFQDSSGATDAINAAQRLTDGDSLVSSGGTFELGFFTPGNSTFRYLGMWYTNYAVKTIVWVANREVPLTNRAGVLRVIYPGILVLISSTNQIIWSSKASTSAPNPVAQLLYNGNFVIRDAGDEREENFLWQSFEHPGDTILPGMKCGWNLLTGVETFMSSWKSIDDPAPGRFTFHLDPTGYPQLLLKSNASVMFRLGPWNGIRFSGATNVIMDRTFNFTFVMDANEVTSRENAIDRSVVSLFTLGPTGIAQRLTWVNRTQEWRVYTNRPSDRCDVYGLCGAYSTCNILNSPTCGCLERFVPKDPTGWVGADWTSGCVRRANLSCHGDVFLQYSGIKLPDAMRTRYDPTMKFEECKRECARNCTCMAYTSLDISTGNGCLFWYGELVDIQIMSSEGDDIYVRLASSESVSKGKSRKVLIASLASGVGVILIGSGIFLCIRNKRIYPKDRGGRYGSSHDKGSVLPSFELSVVLKATDHFSMDNKLGEGGFGPVYKGILKGGQEIAVKRLSKDSVQGRDEFRNEVIFIANLQHRNLVRLLGCCIQDDENLLIYEYLPNKSLDVMLFDQTNRTLLDWPTRFKIINGIARGLLYLHQDSRLKIIHRDLKASNVLLDANMNPKISDFGIARSFGGNEIEAKTHRVVGTYGYMSPEYVMDGLFSVKSDVFSFGVLVLEIVSGKRNRGFSHDQHNLNLLGYAWKLYNESRFIDVVDDTLESSLFMEEMVRSIHVGLLCVQRKQDDRPSMSSVVMMLGNGRALPQANQPGFYGERDVVNTHNSSGSNSSNEITLSTIHGR